MKLILIRNLSSNASAQPAADYMKVVFAHNPHISIKNVVSMPDGSSPFSKKERITVDYDVVPGSAVDIETSIKGAIAIRGDLQLISLEAPGTSCGFSPHY